MKTIQLNESTARSIYPTANDHLKLILEETFGIEFFAQKITDRVKTYTDALNILGNDPVINSQDTPDEIAYKKLKVIVAVLNEGWKPDWSNDDEYKYFPWFNLENGGCVFDDDDYYDTASSAGSRLCFKSRELAEYAAKQFAPIYKDFLTL